MYSAAKHVPVDNAGILKRVKNGFNSWVATRFPTPGAENQAYTTNLLPLNWFVGGANLVQGQLYLGHPLLYVQQSTIPTGIAGIVAGQVRVPSLADNPNNVS